MIIKPEDVILDEYEQEIEDNFDNLKAYPDNEKEKMKMYQQAAKNYLKKNPPISE